MSIPIVLIALTFLALAGVRLATLLARDGTIHFTTPEVRQAASDYKRLLRKLHPAQAGVRSKQKKERSSCSTSS